MSYLEDPKNIERTFVMMEDDSSDGEEEEFAPEPEDLIQGPMFGFSERGPQEDLAKRARDLKNKDKNQDSQPNITKYVRSYY
ncbi:hypothetical protein AZE42_13696 [Rhizopogon vesiculosus]|uniref:Uncharacterized protein n=1 Tax=Rhizopogon vesiculosus TaxID=180088 RepID=A0A1J8QAG1_9AGAM|nr:hypothetical protein AZE42_13696 [Rhizopogon vesiculosus]